MQTAALTTTSPPHSDSSKPGIETSPSASGESPKQPTELENKPTSRIRFGLKTYGDLDDLPDLEPAFRGGSFQVSGDMYALWQYCQAWIKAALTSNTSDYDYPSYYIADISVRIPLVIVELHAGWMNNLSSEDSGYDLRLEKVMAIGSQRIRARIGYGGFSANPDILGSVQQSELYNQYYYGTTLFDNGLMGFTNIQPDSRAYAGISIGNHPGVENPYYLQDTALTELPLADAPKGAYQVDAVFSTSSMEIEEYTTGVNLYLDDGNYYWGYYLSFSMDSDVMKLALAWKPWRYFETRISYGQLESNQFTGLDTGIYDMDSYINQLSISTAYNWDMSPAVRLTGLLSLANKTWGMDYTILSSYSNSDCTFTRTGATLAALLRFKLSDSFFLHARLGLEAGTEKTDLVYSDYYGTWKDEDSDTLFQPQASLGIDLHFEPMFHEH